MLLGVGDCEAPGLIVIVGVGVELEVTDGVTVDVGVSVVVGVVVGVLVGVSVDV